MPKSAETLLLLIVWLLSRFLTSAAEPPQSRPNVIIIVTDDQGAADAGCYGAKDLSTPSIDALAARGVRFTQFYAAAPVCSPSRAALLTGRYPITCGVPGNAASQKGQHGGLPASEVTIAEIFKSAGYATAHIGKWHLGYEPDTVPNSQGFDHSFGHMGGCIDNYSHFFFWAGPNVHDLWRNGVEVFENGQFFPDLMVKEASEFIEKNRRQPFLIYFALNSPHYPYQGRPKNLERYKSLPYPRNLYAAFLAEADERIGALLAKVDALGLRENTIVVYQSDNGHSTEERAHFGGGSAGLFRGAKFSLFEGGIHLPAIVSWPGRLPVGELRTQLAHGCDWLPTLAELCGVKLPNIKLDGKSLARVLESSNAPSPHEVIHWQVGDGPKAQWAVREGDWKLMGHAWDTSANDKATNRFPVWLANVRLDPGERQNQASAEPDTVTRLQKLHVEWLQAALDERAATESNGAKGSFPVQIKVDKAKKLGALKPIWRFFGYDEPNFTYMKDGVKLLGELRQLGPEPVYIRTHHLLTSGDGTPALKWGSTGAYSEDAQGNPVYDWKIMDRIFDTYVQREVRPFVEMGFMPEALSIHPQDYPHHPPRERPLNPGVGFSYPPRDFKKWGDLCHEWAKHSVERYGRNAVEQWFWEVWNEPNIFYWRGTREEYFKLYDYAVDGVRRALPTARVGGPHTAGGPGGTFLRQFLDHCLHGTNYATGKVGSPLDFVAFHAKGSPVFTNGHVRMGISAQLRNIDDGFATVASFPELKNTPIVIGESDPEGCAACRGPQLGYRNGTMYSSYTAASFPRKLDLAAKHGINFEGALTWAFEFEDEPFFAGFRVLASNGIDLPVLNVFRMFGLMRGDRVAATSSADAGVDAMRTQGVRGAADVAALASAEPNRVAVLVWHYHDDDLPGKAADVTLSLAGLDKQRWTVAHYRIDSDHSNAFEAWKKMGSPQQPNASQYAELERAGHLGQLSSPQPISSTEAGANLRFTLPRQGVSLLIFTPAGEH